MGDNEVNLVLPTELQPVIEAIHAAPQRLVLEFAGAGSMMLGWLHSVAGSSQTILEATDRYAATSLADLLGKPPETFVAVETAAVMAQRAYERAVILRDDAVPVLGMACTATIATQRQKRGAHRCAIAVRTDAGTATYALTLTRGRRDRLGEETLVSQLLLWALVRGCDLDLPASLDLTADEVVAEAWHPDPVSRLLAGEIRSLLIHPDGRQEYDPAVSGVLLSGSFNPLHAGHSGLLQAAAQTLQMPGLFELPVVNADKGTLTVAEVTRRLLQFHGNHTVVLSCAPLFHTKADLFPGSVFVVGYDTAIRLVAPRYYGGEREMQQALAGMRDQGCRFLVAGRVVEGVFHTLHDVPVPPAFRDMFIALPEYTFRVDLSSTELRDQADTATR